MAEAIMVPARPRSRTGARTRPAGLVQILSGRAWVGGRLQPIELGIDEEGRIARIARSISSGADRIDLGDQVLLPSSTDPHVHFREPGGSADVETLTTGTTGAAQGGVGLVADMPNTRPPVTTPEVLREKINSARGRLAVDLVVVAGVVPGLRAAELAREAGAFKIYLSPTSGFEQETWSDSSVLAEALNALAQTGRPAIIHAEDPSTFEEAVRPHDLESWSSHRPVEAELVALRRLRSRPQGLRTHIAHVTSPEAASLAAELGVTFEATPHHLFLSTNFRDGAQMKVNPPLRSERVRAALWEMFRSGRVPIAASDHAPHPPSEKAKEFRLAPSGVPGVETLLPLLLQRVRRGELELATLMACSMEGPARLLGIRAGRLEPGYWANIIAVDFRMRRPIRGRRLASPCGWSPFEGMDGVFPMHHWLRGERLLDDGEFVGGHPGRIVTGERTSS